MNRLNEVTYWRIPTSTEKEAMDRILPLLKSKPWARKILREIANRGGFSKKTLDYCFEARIGEMLDRLEVIDLEHEKLTGVGNHSVDFSFTNSLREARLELLCLGDSESVKRNTQLPAGFEIKECAMYGDAPDARNSLGYLLIGMQQRVGKKFGRTAKSLNSRCLLTLHRR